MQLRVGSTPAALEPTYVQREAVVGRLKPQSGGADSGPSVASAGHASAGQTNPRSRC